MREFTKVIGPTDWSIQRTGREMHRLARQYSRDVLPFIHLSLEEFFNKIKMLQYRRDPVGEEYLGRPAATLYNVGRGLDCDDKAITMAAFAYRKGIPYRFLAVGRYADGPVHHVYTEVSVGGRWFPVDATYHKNTYGFQVQDYQKKVILDP